MTIHAAAPRSVDAPPQGLLPADVATIIRELGAKFIDAYNETHGATAAEERNQNAWGSKQREQLLRALLDRLASNARTFENAALSATDSALASFAREQFKRERGTRSHRDRVPITKNIDKVVGGWLRRLGRRMRQDAATVSIAGDVAVRGRRAKFRLSLTMTYRRRVVADRRLLITATVEELTSNAPPSKVPLRSDASAAAVALTEGRRRYTPKEAQAVGDFFTSMASMADMIGDPELKDFVEKGRRAFVPSTVAKVLLVVVLSLTVGVTATPAGRRFAKRVVDAITSSGSLRELLKKLSFDTTEGLFVAPDGSQSQTVQSGSGSEVRISPGPSPELLYVQTSIKDRDLSEMLSEMVALAPIGQIGVNAFQFRSGPHAPIIPWIVEVLVVPEQDLALSAELARRAATISIAYDPPLDQALLRRDQTESIAEKRVNIVSELRELPHTRQTYAIVSTITRQGGTREVHRAELRVDANGFATLARERGKPLSPVRQDVMVGNPICTTILRPHTLPKFIPGQMDYVWALAHPHEEQEAILVIYPPSKSPDVAHVTVEWGDGSKADYEPDKGLLLAKHRYRVGERAYPITAYFEASDVVYQFDLYVFSDRTARGVPTLDYETPYPPNPEVTALAQNDPDHAERDHMSVLVRQGPVLTDSITWSREAAGTVWKVDMGFRDYERVTVRYLWRNGGVIRAVE